MIVSNFVSIITTARNAEVYIMETLMSVYKQTFSEYEHIIIDDGSTDQTPFLVENFKLQHPDSKIKLIKTEGIGRGKALNLGVSKATGNWIAVIDADDLWHPNKLQIQMEVCSAHDWDVLGTEGSLFSDSEVLQMAQPTRQSKIEIVSRSTLLKSNVLSHSSVIMKKEVCRYDENRNSQYDYELWLRLLSEGKSLGIVKESLNYHRIHAGQSFEGKMGKIYRWRSFKLKTKYAFKARAYGAVLYNVLKLAFDFLLPRDWRLKIKSKMKRV